MRRGWRSCLVLLWLAAAAHAADGPLFLWRADRDGATLYLLGSIHAGQEAWYPLDPRIEAAFLAADTLACEIDVADPVVQLKVAGLAMQQGLYPEGESLRDHVSAEVWQRLTQVPGLPVPVALLERMRPGLAAMSVAQAYVVALELDLTQGIDVHLLERAHALPKPIVALETPEEQVALIFGPDAVIDELLLAEALVEDPAELRATLAAMLTAWRTGDPAALEKVYREDWIDDPRMIRFHEAVLVRRNRGMADGLAARRGTWFVVVGALHLCGDEGVPALLAARGWTVTQVR